MSRSVDPAQVRRRKLAAIHAEAKRLALDNDTYRALLARITGHASAKDCTLAQLSLVIAEMARLSGKPKREVMAARVYAGKPKDMTPLLHKVEALLTDAGREWSYGHGMARRMFKAQRLEWLNPDQLHRVVAALQVDANRRRKRAQGVKA